MIEKNPLELYEKELKEQKTILDSLNKNLEELIREKGKMNKYEYEERYSQEESKINQYINRTKLEISRLENIIEAYHNIEEETEKIKQLETIIPRDSQEREELDTEKRYIEELKKKNMTILPEEMKSLFLTENPETIVQKEKISNDIILEDNKGKEIDDYRKEMEENEKEIKHLKENIEKLNSLKSSIPLQEYERDLATLKRYKNRENGKLLRNRQIVTAYELIENNQERISYLNSLIARDEQDAREIKEEFDFLTAEIEKNKRFIPKNLYQSLATIDHKEENLTEETEKIEYLDEEATPEEIESYEKELRDRIRNENEYTIDPKLVFKNRTTQEPVEQIELSEDKSKPNFTIVDPKQETTLDGDKTEIDFTKSQDLFRKIKDLSPKNQNNPSLVSLTDTLKVASQDNSSQQKSYGLNLEDIKTPKIEVVDAKDITPIYESSSTVETSQRSTPEEVLNTYFKDLENEQNSSKHKSNTSTTSTSESSTPKEELSDNVNEEEKETSSKSDSQNEELESNENKENQHPTLSEKLKEDIKQPKKSRVIRTRKSKKNIKNKIIQKTAIIATGLVLISVGINGCSSKKYNPTPTAVIENDETNLGKDDIEIIDAPNQTYSRIDSTESITEDLEKDEFQTELGTQTIIGQQVETSQAIPQPSPGQNTGAEILIELEDLINPQMDTDFSKTTEVTDSDALESAFMNSGIIEKKAEDEYSASQGKWEGVKDENIQYWIDNPLRFIEDEKTGAYLMEQQDENGNWVGMGWTDSDTTYQYLQNLESYENQTGKGRH